MEGHVMELLLWSGVIIIAAGVVWKLYLKLSVGFDRSPTCLIGKTAIVTGSNTGIGYYTAEDFAKRGARVILACRNRDKAEEAKAKIIKNTDNENVHVKLIDFGSLKSIRDFAQDIIATESRLDILVNNAGAIGLQGFTKDGLLMMMQVNHFGPFLLTNLLLELLKKSSPSRIVNVASVASRFGSVDPNRLNVCPSGWLYESRIYANTKFCNVIFSNELARRLKNTRVTVNSLHPGAVNTDIFRRAPSPLRQLMYLVFNNMFKNSYEGAQTSIYLSVSKEVEGVSGCYYSDCRRSRMPGAARDETLAKKIWDKTEEFVNIKQ